MSSQVVIGIDPSWTATAVAGHKWEFEREVKGREKNRVRALRRFCADLEDMVCPNISMFSDPFAIIEGYSMGSRIGREAAGELGGAIRSMLDMHGFKILEVPPTVLKKWVTGKGTAKKEDMKLHAYKRFGFEDPSNNIIDAKCLRELGLWILNSDTKAARDVEKKCNWLL